jgi:hypothetical protein
MAWTPWCSKHNAPWGAVGDTFCDEWDTANPNACVKQPCVLTPVNLFDNGVRPIFTREDREAVKHWMAH